jgi:hypothetical protein
MLLAVTGEAIFAIWFGVFLILCVFFCARAIWKLDDEGLEENEPGLLQRIVEALRIHAG